MISIIIPVYNIEKYIEKAIVSVVNQTCPDFELLLVNDGSTDSSYEICKKWEEKDNRIKVISKENGGVSSARNLGMELAKGEYLFFLDGDDWIREDCLEKLLSHMTPDVDLVISDYQEVDDEGYRSTLNLQHKHFEGILTKLDAIQDLYESQIYPKVIWGKLYRKELWENIRFNHMAYSEDTYAMFQVLELTEKIYSVDEPLYFYLQRGGSASHQLKLREYENYLETLYFTYNRALESYPQLKALPGREYLGYAYILLKKYQQAHQKKQAMELIKKMQFVYKTADIEHPKFAEKAMAMPKFLIYLLIGVKNMISK